MFFIKKCLYMKEFTFTIIFFWCLCSNAQTSINSGGGNASSGETEVSYSIGQTFYSYSSSENGANITEGVQQPFVIISSGILDATLTAEVYPNPAKDHFVLSINEETDIDFTAKLVDMSGRVIRTVRIMDPVTHFDVESLPAAVYFLYLTDDRNTMKTFKIIKQ